MIIPTCHPEAKHCAKGLCRKCYDAKWKRDKRATDPEFKAKTYARTKQWHTENPEYERARSKRRYAENPEKYKEYTKLWWNKQHKGLRKIRRSQLTEDQRDLIRNANNPAEIKRLYKRFWKENNKEAYLKQMRAHVKTRKALKKGAAIRDFTASDWEEMKLIHNNTCFYCGEVHENLTQDHCLPLSKGGDHTKTNIVPACTTCNNKKGTKTKEEFLYGMASAR